MALSKAMSDVWTPFKKYFALRGVRLRVTSTTRTKSKQKWLWEHRAQLPYPVAPPGRSQHEYGFAVDAVANPISYQKTVGEFWVSIGGTWNAADPVHFAYFGAADWETFLQGGGLQQMFPASSLAGFASSYAGGGYQIPAISPPAPPPVLSQTGGRPRPILTSDIPVVAGISNRGISAQSVSTLETPPIGSISVGGVLDRPQPEQISLPSVGILGRGIASPPSR